MEALNAMATHAGMLALLMAGLLTAPLVVAAAMQYRKSRARALRRSPIGIDLLRPPGHTLREQMDETMDDYQGLVLLVFLVPSTLMAILLAQAHVLGTARVMSGWPFDALLAIGALVHAIYRLWQIGQRMDRLRQRRHCPTEPDRRSAADRPHVVRARPPLVRRPRLAIWPLPTRLAIKSRRRIGAATCTIGAGGVYDRSVKFFQLKLF